MHFFRLLLSEKNLGIVCKYQEIYARLYIKDLPQNSALFFSKYVFNIFFTDFTLSTLNILEDLVEKNKCKCLHYSFESFQ